MFKEYIKYLKDNPEGYWFKRKLYGWGWVPVRWQGWFTIFVFVAMLTINAFRLHPRHNVADGAVTTLILETLVMVIILMVICYKKGERPRWSWGPDQK